MLRVTVEQVKSLVWGDLSRPVVTYCHSGVRAGQAELTLRSAGFTNVLNGGGWAIPPSNTPLLQSLCRCASACAVDDVPSTMGAFVSPTPSFEPSFRTPRLGPSSLSLSLSLLLFKIIVSVVLFSTRALI